MKVGDIVHGFKVLSRETVDEVSSVAYEMEHIKSGARLFYLSNDDDNKVFSISFRTPPEDDTGVAHIVEHSTLCGSRKYPLKEPFVELVKGSLNTFLNAMTFPDKTMYPLASRNDKDFQNLMDVYLDAVFHPAMLHTPEVLMQEGWHYEMDGMDKPLRLSGVVYNEMKGALSSPDDLLSRKMMSALYPDTAYSYESGGDPESIPNLTQEGFVGFHKKFYHPANSYIYLYGKMDIDEKLSYLDSEYLSQYDRIDPHSELDYQKPFDKMQEVIEYYPVGSDEDTKGRTYIALSLSVSRYDDAETLLALEILESALFRSEAAPVRKAILEAGIGKDIGTDFSDELLQPMFSVILEGSDSEKKGRFLSIVKDTISELVRNGIDKTLLEAAINPLEFKLREADFGAFPKGLIYGIRIMNSWLYGGSPSIYLHYEDLLRKMRDGLNTRYFEDIADKILLKNPHQVLVIMEPDKELAEKREKRLAESLAAKKASMSQEELQALMDNAHHLKERQQSPETPEALATIPLLKRDDIKKESDDLPLEVIDVDQVKLLYSDIETNGIAYISFYFDMRTLPQELIPYAFMLGALLGAVDTKSRSYTELVNEINLHTGGFTFESTSIRKKDDPDVWRPVFKIKSKVLLPKTHEAFRIMRELMQSRFSDKKRIYDLLKVARAGFESDVLAAPQTLMAIRLGSYLSEAGAFAENGGLSAYPFLCNIIDDFDRKYEETASKLVKTLELIASKNGLIVGLTAPRESLKPFLDELKAFLDDLPEHTEVPAWHFNITNANEGIYAASAVQYVGKAGNFLRHGFKYTGAMRVLETMLRYGYFWTKIRVQGGAYGASTRITRSGLMMFSSYRDPNLRETLDVFDHTAEAVAAYNASPRELDKLVIGTISGLDTPLTPKMKGNLAANCWLEGITKEDRQRTRDEVLGVTLDDLHSLAPVIDSVMKDNVFCVFGGDAKIRADKDIFGSLVPAMK